jgi:hypothetical protein
VENQAKVTGAATHYGAQAAVQADGNHEARRRAAINLISRKGTTATLAALTRLPDMHRSRDEDEEGEDSGDQQGRQGQNGRGRPLKR